MQKRSTHSQGFAILPLLLGIVTIALGVALVYIFMNNSAENKSAQKVADSSNTTEKTTEEQSEVASKGVSAPDAKDTPKKAALMTSTFGTAVKESFSLNYPENWRYTVTEEKGTETTLSGTKVKVTSPSGRFVVDIYVAVGGGLGGQCDPQTDKGTIQEIVYEKVSGVKALHDRNKPSDVYYVEQLDTRTDGTTVKEGRVFMALMMPNEFYGPMSNVKKGDSVCKTALGDVLRLPPYDKAMMMFTKVDIKGDIKSLTFKELQQLEEVQQAKAILMSLKRK